MVVKKYHVTMKSTSEETVDRSRKVCPGGSELFLASDISLLGVSCSFEVGTILCALEGPFTNIPCNEGHKEDASDDA
jgi:hypothetical protein